MTPIVHRRRVVPIPLNSMENSVQKHVKKFEHDPRVGSLDMDLFSRYSSLVGGMAPTIHHQRLVPIPCNSMENRFQKQVKQFECDPTVGSLYTDLLNRYSSPSGGMAPTGHHRRVVPIPHNSMENSLWKVVKKFECDPTVRSLDTDILSRYSGLFGGMALTVHHRRVVPIPRNSMDNSLQKHVKHLSAIQRSDI